jgi:hypothetical protein
MNIPPSAMPPSENDDFVTDLDSRESGGACPQIESKFHFYDRVRACNQRDETIDAALTSALVIASNVR